MSLYRRYPPEGGGPVLWTILIVCVIVVLVLVILGKR